jgi:hypothetical protein
LKMGVTGLWQLKATKQEVVLPQLLLVSIEIHCCILHNS